MFFVEIYRKIFGYDYELGVTFEYAGKQWKVSSVPLHEIEQMNLRELNYLTMDEVKVKTDIDKLDNMRKTIRKLFKEI